jgi:hypothetical protein
MTSEEARRAFVASVAKLPYSDRRSLIEELVKAHNAARVEALEYGFEEPGVRAPGLMAAPKTFVELS